MTVTQSRESEIRNPGDRWCVFDLGSGPNPDPRATETADADPTANADWHINLDETWPWAANSVDGLIANHLVEHLADPVWLFSEAGRVLRTRGFLEVTVPIGEHAIGDRDHETTGWNPRKLREYGDNHRRSWQEPTGMDCIWVTVEPEMWGWEGWKQPLYQLLATRWPAKVAAEADGGELIGRFEPVGGSR